MTQENLAEALRLSSVYISQIETGKRKPSLKTVYKMAKVFNVPIGMLLNEININCVSSGIDELIRMLKNRSDEEVSMVTETVQEMLRHIKDKKVIKKD